MRRFLLLVVLLSVVTSVAWSLDASVGIEDPLDTIDAAVDALEQSWVGRFDMDWDAFVSDIWGAASMSRGLDSAIEVGDTLDPAGVVEYIVQRLQSHFGDLHAAFYAAEEIARAEAVSSQFVADFEAGRATSDGFSPCGGIVEGNVAYVWIPPTSDSGAGLLAPDYIWAKGMELLDVVESLDENGPRGWVIDLRQHLGGSYQVGLIGLQSFLPEGRLFGFVYPPQLSELFLVHAWIEHRGREFLWTYHDLQFMQTKSVIVDVSEHALSLRNPDAPIAVLTSSWTASAAEMMLVALRQNPRVRTFGEPTSGVSTDRDGFALPDGSRLVFSSGYLADPDGHVYHDPSMTGYQAYLSFGGSFCVSGEPVQPDVPAYVPRWGDVAHEAEKMATLGPQAFLETWYDPAYRAALAWIDEQAEQSPATDP